MATAKSPFIVMRGFLSPFQCEQSMDKLGFFSPDVDQNENPIKMMRHQDDNESEFTLEPKEK
jgi:hypothetical protein